MKKQGGRSIYLAAIALLLGGVGYLAYSGFAQGSVYVLKVSELLAEPETGKATRLVGTVEPEGMQKTPDGLRITFRLADTDTPDKTVWIDYQGVVPDTFAAGAEVIVEGSLNTPASFQATKLMTKCPSKYEKENRT